MIMPHNDVIVKRKDIYTDKSILSCFFHKKYVSHEKYMNGKKCTEYTEVLMVNICCLYRPAGRNRYFYLLCHNTDSDDDNHDFILRNVKSFLYFE